MIVCSWFLLMGHSSLSYAEETDRRARWHASFKPAEPVGREITAIEPESALHEAGLLVGDIVLAINGEAVKDGNHWWDLTYNLRAATHYILMVRRNGRVEQKNVQFQPTPKETYDTLATEYGFITSDYGIRQRTITTWPIQLDGPNAAIFVVGGLSCSSIEYLPGRQSNFIRALRDLAQHSGMAMMRVEKPGVGDSEGRCSETDFVTELNGYEVALQQFLAEPRINRDKVIVFGSSMGGALAPYLANKYTLNGVIADGPFYRSWFEHMLEIERRIQSMNGLDETTVNQRMIEAYIPLYYGMLVEKKSYQAVINQSPLLAEYNYHGAEHMYGRPVAFYHQMQQFDVAGGVGKTICTNSGKVGDK